MAKHAFHFRGYAVDETAYWNPPDILAGVPVFGVYFICEGEATHICSFEASSRAEFLENVFLLPPEAYQPDDQRGYDSAQKLAADNLAYDHGGEPCSYFDYVDCAKRAKRPYLSPRITITLDSRDYDLDQVAYEADLARALRWSSPLAAHAEARRRGLIEHAWDAAREYLHANGAVAQNIPVLLDPQAYEAHRLRAVMAEAIADERYYGPPPLFAYAGITAPLAAQPARRAI